ncbi:tRNA (adenosine(37)-N6)-threonylcarbamoyltransferase complex dimerization subunit type 1 TsaB [Microbacterium sp. YY-01]|uniref:tRNA (adenosine(37)-N6)-threonylcarbamoyltransferase complex dimerization subunit type 1 TsaB n=1 Tax=Microbacterium sp. YY-01 TaxID=3421634 RepID=UPI003D170044
MILAVDTSLGSAAALINAEGATLAEASSSDPLGHAEVIGQLIQSVLDSTPDTSTITHVVAGMGPGPFTGLRIGIAAARAFALARKIPVIAVPSHWGAALDAMTREPDATARPFAVITDARRREAAVTIFEGLDNEGLPAAVVDTVLVPRAEVETRLGGIRGIETTELSAAALARVGQRAAAAERTLCGPEPLYLREPDARQPVPPKRVAQ